MGHTFCSHIQPARCLGPAVLASARHLWVTGEKVCLWRQQVLPLPGPNF